MKIRAGWSYKLPQTAVSEQIRVFASNLPVLLLSLLIFLCPDNLKAQSMSESIGGKAQTDSTGIYLFYLHGGIVQTRGPEADVKAGIRR